MKAAVVIPFYKPVMSNLEHTALVQATKVLSAHDIIVIKPHNLILPDEAQLDAIANVINFDDRYFKNIKGYNALMLSEEFYRSFLTYDFMLIHQLDAFVFSDELMEWCTQGYDYIGAPWIHKYGYPDVVKAVKSKLQRWLHLKFDVQKDGRPSPMQFENGVGNGGFSLRRVNKFHELCINMKNQAKRYLSLSHDHYFNEDVFWSIEVNRKRKVLNIPSYKKATGFSIELFPERAIKINNNKLPFGCHAWDKNLDYWRPVIQNYGYEI
ncbi:hypothetical protein ABIC45_003916 [Mucilaginibacter rubeus]|uniref:DUF5672 family protein n=1 Tax=Mucilaginibacter rubeus TaxID=2027860 RepID=UPI0033916816